MGRCIMKIKIEIETPNEFERELIAAAGVIWSDFLSEIPDEVVERRGEVAWLAQTLLWDRRVVTNWLKASGAWDTMIRLRKVR